ncbi:MAG: STAS domain-containing protein [Magnetococcales bacterium]|nr:STAS domain-containing protein [Magnetococcales bacterium]MBF0437585.1 STAS domain-containing protein [Magnetococcales bacterium]
MTTKTDSKVVTIHLEGVFDYNKRLEFRKTYAAYPPGTVFELDFSKVDSLDSSGLGMLLVMREQVGGEKANISFINCKPDIRHLFQISQFKELFHLR